MHEKLFENFLEKKKKIEEEIEKIKKTNFENLKWNILPEKIECDVVAIDGSFNYFRFKSFAFYTISAVSFSKDSMNFKFDCGILPNFYEINEILKIKMLVKELELAEESKNVVILDGSISSFYSYKPYFIQNDEKIFEEWKKIREKIEILEKREDLIFSIAKTFNVAKDKIPPAYLYEKFDSGYSEIFKEGEKFISFYFKLSKKSQVYKCVTFEKNRNRVEEILSILRNFEVDGYPYLLKKAHNAAKISRRDIKNMFRILGIIDKSGREVLE
jgi:NurA-like 5'-3' nuclease